MTEEEGQKGNVPLSVYILYFREAGIIIMSVTLFCFVVSTAGNLLCNFVLFFSVLPAQVVSGYPTGLDHSPILLGLLMKNIPHRTGLAFILASFLPPACSSYLGKQHTCVVPK